MTIFIAGILLLIISFILAIRALSELETPTEIRRLMKDKKKSTLSGVIVFFKKRVVHYRS